MKNNIFIKEFPLAMFWAFLNSVCKFDDTYYLIDKTVFLKMVIDQKHVPFVASLKEYYYKSKNSYLENILKYNGFVSILRQICNFHKHPYTTVKKYNHCDYTICYFIERPRDNLDFLI